MAKINERDFVELTYTGKLKEDNSVFDTCDEKIAKENKIHSPNMEYGSIVICIGEGQLLRGLEHELVGKEVGKHTIELSAVDAFGKKDAKMIQLIPTSKFIQQRINPFPGLQVNIDGTIGTVKTVTGGRTVVDFNHPLSGKDVVYDIEVKNIVVDKAKKLSSTLKMMLGINDPKIKMNGENAEVTLKKRMPEALETEFTKKLVEITGIKDIKFVEEAVAKTN